MSPLHGERGKIAQQAGNRAKNGRPRKPCPRFGQARITHLEVCYSKLFSSLPELA